MRLRRNSRTVCGARSITSNARKNHTADPAAACPVPRGLLGGSVSVPMSYPPESLQRADLGGVLDKALEKGVWGRNLVKVSLSLTRHNRNIFDKTCFSLLLAR